MDKLQINIAQLNPIVGDLEYNYNKIKVAWANANAIGDNLIVFSECMLTGYPLEDLSRNVAFLDEVAKYIEKIKNDPLVSETAMILGSPRREGDKFYNSAFVFKTTGEDPEVFDKFELPNYGPFDEKRNFDRHDAPTSNITNIHGFDIQVQICEDIWFPNVTAEAEMQTLDATIVINGSPWQKGKNIIRESVINQRIGQVSKMFRNPIIYVNQVGGQDELVFDGSSFVMNWNQEKILQLESFGEDSATVTLTKLKNDYSEIGISNKNHALTAQNNDRNLADPYRMMYEALVLGTRDYLRKTNTSNVVLGLSGGVDSALVAAIAADAVGPDNVLAVRLPSRYSSQHSLDDAADLAERMGIDLITVNIDAAHSAFEAMIPGFLDPDEPTVADENIQARARAGVLMSISNKTGRMLLSTGNKSETATGFSTLGGDMMGGYNPLKDVYKTEVWALCHWRNKNTITFGGSLLTDVIPETIITKPPSAELATGQLDTNSLPEYPILDDILYKLIELDYGVEETVRTTGYPVETVLKVKKLLNRAEYKRRQAPPGVKISTMEFGIDRRYPIVNHWVG